MSEFITISFVPIITGVGSMATSLFSQSPFKLMLLGVLGLSVLGLILGFVRR